jgi:pyruvate,orthophosphate dikinase
MAAKYIYAFGGGTADGRGDQKELLGGKGAGLAEMSRLGIPVPPGFTLTTEVCTWFQEHHGSYPPGLEGELDRQLRRLEALTGQRFGDVANPLLVSVRSGAPMSMPGMMDTVLNLGLSQALVDAWIARGADARFVLDAWRRLLTMYGDVVLGVEHAAFEEILAAARAEHGAASDNELPPAALAAVAEKFRRLIAEHGQPFPEEPRAQLWGAIGAVFSSWNNRRAREYRRINGISDRLGTAVNVQAMVFGNRGNDCATGVAFTRNPATGEARVYGEYLVNAQGEDVVAGIRTPRPIVGLDGGRGLAEDFPQADRELREVCARLERHYRDMQDVEFTIQHDRLYMLQTRRGARTGPAAVRIAAELVDEGIITPREAVSRVKPDDLVQVLAPEFDVQEKARAVADGRLLARGLPAGPGAASGRMVLSADRAAELAAQGPVILVRAETSPEDIVGMHAAAGILTSRGGMTSHAAVVARGMGKPCLVGAGDLDVDERAGVVRAGERELREGEEISIDGTTGEVIAGGLATRPSAVLRTLVGDAGETGGDTAGKTAAAAKTRAAAAAAAPSPAVISFRKILTWADELRRMRVRANADTPVDARVSRALGGEGIGLCRTEHMFFAADRISWVRRMILADDAEDRAESLAQLLPMQQKDFEGIFAALSGLPVTVRLLDPPLHEFLPHGDKALASLAKQMGVPAAKVAARAAALAEANPMLGHRGCRLGMTAPEIYDMQVEAIARAACVRTRAGDHVEAEIMVPLVGAEQEMIRLREHIVATVERVLTEENLRLPIAIGTMIEVPRAALIAAKIAVHADFFSFGTNDLTQMTYGYSRDDIGRFLPQYLESGVLPYDPFARLDDEGVGQLVRLACESGRGARADLHLGVCGEHGGDPDSIDFFDRVGLDYVSCSPYRVPVARLAAAQATLAREREAGSGKPSAAARAETQQAAAATASRRTSPAKGRPRRAAAASAGRSGAAATAAARQAGKSGAGIGRTPASTRRPARAASSKPAAGAGRSPRAAASGRAAAARRPAARRPAAVAATRKPPKAARSAGRAAARGAAGTARSRSGAGARKPALPRPGAVPAKSRGIAARIRRSTARKAVTAAAGKASRAAGSRAKAATGRAAKVATGRAGRLATGRMKPVAAGKAAGRRPPAGGRRRPRR